MSRIVPWGNTDGSSMSNDGTVSNDGSVGNDGAVSNNGGVGNNRGRSVGGDSLVGDLSNVSTVGISGVVVDLQHAV